MFDSGRQANPAERFRQKIAARMARAGYKRDSSIPEDMTFRAWCEDLGRKGLKIDRKPFRLDDRPALNAIYDAIPTTRAEAKERVVVVQKATQIGLTVWEVLADIYMAKKWGPVNIGLFLPDQNTAGFKSEHRFMPIVRSAPEIHRELITREDIDGKSRTIGEGNVLTRQLGISLLMFLWTTGKVSTESRPMDIVSLDEVQGMTMGQIDKVRARTGDSDVQFTLLLSTANMPDLDINAWFKLGTQEVWHTRCPHCQALSDLSDPGGIFPNRSIKFNAGQVIGAPLEDYVWTCPVCEGWIEDPQQGEYVVMNPGADPLIRSFLLPRTISPRMTPRQMITGWGRAKTGDQKKSFYNRTLARPYIDADQLPVTMEHCLACVAEGMRMGLVWEKYARECVMGIDQMGSFNVVIIKRRLPDGRQAVVHVEAIFNDNPFARCSELMRQYGVTVCVVEQLPNVNDARRFANEFRGRVFLAGYADLRDDMMQWGDDLTDSDRHTSAEDRSRYTVALNQYKAMQTALYRIRDKHCLFPNPDDLVQEVIETGGHTVRPKKRGDRNEDDDGTLDALPAGDGTRIPILRDWVFYHFTKTALVVEEDEHTRKRKPKVLKIGIDPHFSYANMLCDIAWARSYGTGMIILPENPAMGAPKANPDVVREIDKIEKAMPGLPKGVVGMLIDQPQGTCGRCVSFPRNPDGTIPPHATCEYRGLVVQARDPNCPLYDPVPAA